MAYADRRLKIIHLSRNFGHQSAVHAGLTFADGDAVVMMDSDGQDDPAAIKVMLDRWLEETTSCTPYGSDAKKAY